MESTNLLIREFEPNDISSIHRIAATDGFAFYNLDSSLETAEKFVMIAMGLATAPVRNSFKMAVDLREKPGQCMGYAAINAIDMPNERTPGIGYFIDPQQANSG